MVGLSLRDRKSVCRQSYNERAVVLAGSKIVDANDLRELEGDMKFWYAVNTKSRCEDFARASLDRLGVEVFFPMLRERKVLRGKSYLTISPLFPQYLFAKFEVSSQLRAVAYAQGVKSIVTFGSGPSMVDESIVHAIRSQAINGAIEFSGNRFVPGQGVRIQDGPLCGLEAVFEKKLDGTSRAVLLLKAISFQARVILESQHVVNM
jgi:transcriptional antiterminator RfaH